jgi:dephospho-CoA kinase
MLHVGITGGIGSGKSTVCRIFAVLGIPIYDADSQAKQLMTADPELRQAIAGLLGSDAYQPDGTLNRAYISGRVFSHPELLAQLNGLVHPAVGRHSLQWREAQLGTPYTLYEAALLLESGGYKRMDKLIVVTAPLEVRIERVIRRDGLSREDVEARIARQWPEEQKMAAADFLIHNDNQTGLISQVLAIHRQLKALSEPKP